jgi:hypothetical protein
VCSLGLTRESVLKIFLFAFTVLGLLFSAVSYADRCWMTGGCVGREAYMYVPDSQFHSDPAWRNNLGNYGPVITEEQNRYVEKNGEKFVLDYRFRLFTQLGLPEVGSVVTLNVNANFYDEKSILSEAFTKAIDTPTYEFVRGKARAKMVPLHWDSELASGSKVRILGYRKFDDFPALKDKLFAHILVLTE